MLCRTLLLFFLCLSPLYAYNVNRPLVICYETHPEHENAQKLKLWLDAFGYQSIFIGRGEKWVGFGQKVMAVERFLKQLDDEQIVIVSDARDVLPMRPAIELDEYIENTLKSSIDFESQIYIGREFYPGSVIRRMNYYYPGEILERNGDICQKKMHVDALPFHRYPVRLLNKFPITSPKDLWLDLFALDQDHLWRSHTSFATVNAGFYMAKVKVLKKVYAGIAMTPGEDDQQLLSEYYYLFPEKVALDQSRSLIYNCTPSYFQLPGQWLEKRWYHEKGNAPFFVHFFAKNYEGLNNTHQRLLENYPNR